MGSTNINWFLLGLFIILTVLFSVVLIYSPSNGDTISVLGRVGSWLGLFASVTQVLIQVFEIRKKKLPTKDDQ